MLQHSIGGRNIEGIGLKWERRIRLNLPVVYFRECRAKIGRVTQAAGGDVFLIGL